MDDRVNVGQDRGWVASRGADLGHSVGHVIDLLAGGVLVYDAVPAWLAGYWVALTALDPAAAVLVTPRRRTGLVLAAVVPVTDAAANGYQSTFPSWAAHSMLGAASDNRSSGSDDRNPPVAMASNRYPQP